MNIVFKEDHKVDDKTSYSKGAKLECNDASANHFISRGVAEIEKKQSDKGKKGSK